MAQNLGEELPGFKDIEGAYQFLKTKGLLVPYRFCRVCHFALRIKENKSFPPFDAWTCDNQKCRKRSVEIESIRGSFFNYTSNSTNLPRQLRCVKHWCDKLTTTEAQKDLGISQDAVLYYYKKCRSFISDYYKDYPIELGGEGVHIAVRFRELSSSKRSYLLMMVDTSNHNRIGYMQILTAESLVPTNTLLPTVLPIIEKVVKPGSVVAYDGEISPLQGNAKNLTFITCTNFEINALESYNMFHFKTFLDIKKDDPEKSQLVLNECMWRERVENNVFGSFIDHLRKYYNPSNFYL